MNTVTRVIAGSKRGKKLINPGPEQRTRPLMDRIKTSIFDLIREFIKDAKVLDLYAGGGNFGIEALSRGAKHATFVDISAQSYKSIGQNLINTNFLEQATLVHLNVEDYLRTAQAENRQFDIIFADPPFKEIIVEHLEDATKILGQDGVFIMRTPAENTKAPNKIGRLSLVYSKKYGKSLLSFYQMV